MAPCSKMKFYIYADGTHTHTTLSHTTLPQPSDTTLSNITLLHTTLTRITLPHSSTHNIVTHNSSTRSKRGIYGFGLGQVARLVAHDVASLCLAGVAFGDITAPLVWQAWHLWHNSSTHNFFSGDSFTHNSFPHTSFTQNSEICHP